MRDGALPSSQLHKEAVTLLKGNSGQACVPVIRKCWSCDQDAAYMLQLMICNTVSWASQ